MTFRRVKLGIYSKDEIPQETPKPPEIKKSMADFFKRHDVFVFDSIPAAPDKEQLKKLEKLQQQVMDIKELRNKTGAGMMDCKKALCATDWDMDRAIEYLRTLPPIPRI